MVAGPSGRAALLQRADGRAFEALRESERDIAVLARDEAESGVLNWMGPMTHVVLASTRGRSMSVEMARSVVDYIFTVPRPTLRIEIAMDGRDGWPAAWFLISYSRRRAEWLDRGLELCFRAAVAPTAEQSAFFSGHRVAVRAELCADGGPPPRLAFPAARARVRVDPRARNPEAWVDALSSAGCSGVEWVPPRAASSNSGASRRYARFVSRALDRMIETHERSDLRDELAVALLSARPWDVPGTDLFETMAYAPDGTVYSSEEGWALDVDGGDAAFRLGRLPDLRFEDLPASPSVPALVAASVGELQPLCSACVYRRYCHIPPSLHARAQGTLSGRLPDSPSCTANMALLDAVFSRWDDQKCIKALEKWAVDIARCRW